MTRETLLTDWNFMRLLRLAIGIFIAVEAIQTHDYLTGFIGAFFMFQAITNTGCCGSNGCAVPVSKTPPDKLEDVEFEEIKTK